jgi:hypothetical protein
MAMLRYSTKIGSDLTNQYYNSLKNLGQKNPLGYLDGARLARRKMYKNDTRMEYLQTSSTSVPPVMIFKTLLLQLKL